MRRWIANVAADVAEWCMARSAKWLQRSEFWTDISEWLDGRDTWAAIRARRKGEG